MDPFLENPVWFPNFHHFLISEASRALQPQLRHRGYLVTIGERLWVTEPGRSIFPDVTLLDRPARARPPEGGTALLEADEPVRVTTSGSEVRQPYLEILDARDQHLVTGIEFLSPSNKYKGAGRDKYIAKQREILRSRANLVEVDLLRSGRHSIAIPEHLIVPALPHAYRVCLSRSDRPFEYEWYPIAIGSCNQCRKTREIRRIERSAYKPDCGGLRRIHGD
jgi:hypothetical protein